MQTQGRSGSRIFSYPSGDVPPKFPGLTSRDPIVLAGGFSYGPIFKRSYRANFNIPAAAYASAAAWAAALRSRLCLRGALRTGQVSGCYGDRANCQCGEPLPRLTLPGRPRSAASAAEVFCL